jgi:hypothetical protein
MLRSPFLTVLAELMVLGPSGQPITPPPLDDSEQTWRPVMKVGRLSGLNNRSLARVIETGLARCVTLPP